MGFNLSDLAKMKEYLSNWEDANKGSDLGLMHFFEHNKLVKENEITKIVDIETPNDLRDFIFLIEKHNDTFDRIVYH